MSDLANLISGKMQRVITEEDLVKVTRVNCRRFIKKYKLF